MDFGIGISDLGSRIWDLGCGMWDLGFGIWDLGLEEIRKSQIPNPKSIYTRNGSLDADAEALHFCV